MEADMTTLDETAGLFVGCYPLGRLLGRGGMADVYASVDPRSGDRVAVKVFRGAGIGGADRRSAEVRTLTDLRHPNLVELLDAGTQDGYEYLVMALVEGPTLGQACRQRLSLMRTAQVGAAVADALAYVHAGDVVHRDVKPDNVLLGPGPRVRLADFGIARMVSATRITQSGLLVGTAAYLAPEQVTGDEVAAPADVYALGLVLLECLTGRQEYPGTAFESAFARLYRRPQLPPELPAGWAALLDAMTANDPEARPSAVSAAGALHQLSAAPETGTAALVQAMGAPLTVPFAPAAAAPTAPAAVAIATPARTRPAAGDEGGSAGRRRLRRLLPLAAASLVVLTPAGIASERVLRSVGSTARPAPSTHSPAVAGPTVPPVTPSAPTQTVDALQPGQDAIQWRRADSSQPPALAAVGSGDGTSSATALGGGPVSPPSATSTPVAGNPPQVAGGGTGGGARSPSTTATSSASPLPSPAAGSAGTGPGGGSAVSPSIAPSPRGPSPSSSAPAATPSPTVPSPSPQRTSSSSPGLGTATAVPTPSVSTGAVTASGPSERAQQLGN